MFAFCHQLASVKIPASVKTIKTWGFAYSGLETVYFDDNSDLMEIGDQVSN